MNNCKSDGIDKLYAYDNSHNFITVDDIDIQVNTREKFRHYGATFNVAGSSFNIAVKDTKNSLKFAIENERHMTGDVEGLLGFTMAQSYEVKDIPIKRLLCRNTYNSPRLAPQ